MTELQLFPDQVGPATFFAASARATVSLEFKTTEGTWWIKELRVWRGSWEMTGPLRGRVYRVNPDGSTGTLVAGTAVVIPVRGLGWQVKQLTTPVLLDNNVTYRACYWNPSGINATLKYWSW